MSPEKQRIAVAKAIGWTNIKIIPLPASNKKHSGEAGVSVCGARHPSWGFGSCSVPDYPNDLNAMHEAEKVLTEHQNDSIYPRNLGAWRNPTKAIYAPAAQRSEAFLRTLGLWEEAQ